MILKPTGTSFDIYADANFAGNWKQSKADSQDTTRSQHGYIILYAGCPILWASQLQMEIVLSSTESKFIGLSTALCTTIPIIELVKELKGQGFNMVSTQPIVHCHVFEDNSGALKIATQRCTHAPSTTTSSSTTSGTMSNAEKLRFMPSTPMISWLTCSPSH